MFSVSFGYFFSDLSGWRLFYFPMDFKGEDSECFRGVKKDVVFFGAQSGHFFLGSSFLGDSLSTTFQTETRTIVERALY